ncbi:MAG: molybdate ABC transporter substrate-binding protein [Deltaproteobacteria bacterium]|jgi:molybdate transport system substrate-binding protein|nr:molybdate ABC transporter substrate-binding protein [Deltaproteobacteria bacterium]
MKKSAFKISVFSLLFVFASGVAAPAVLRAEDFNVAVAANFTSPATEIAGLFEKATGDRPVLSFGSTGNFKTQIINGAPFAILLAADAKTPLELEEGGEAVAGTRFTYAKGALVLWSSEPGYVDDKARVLEKNEFRFIALANPDLAPYGFAGREFLKKTNLFDKLESEKKIVTGNNISDTYQSVKTGNAELGLIAWSQVCKDNELESGSVYKVPADLYSPILQDAVLLKKGADSKAAKAFLDFLRNDPKALKIILSYGYELGN